MISQGASEINISFVVQESDVPKAVRHLHEHFFPAGEPHKIVSAKSKKNGIANNSRNGPSMTEGPRKGRSSGPNQPNGKLLEHRRIEL